MRGTLSNADKNPRPSYPPPSFRRWLADQIFVHKLSTWPGILGLLSVIALMALLAALTTPEVAFSLFILALLIPSLIFSVIHLRFGIFLIICISFFLLGAKRIWTELPLGILIDISIMLMLFGLGIRMVRAYYWPRLTHPVTWLVIAWIGYNFLQIGNPAALSEQAWLYNVRGLASWMLVYFIALYAFDKIDGLKQLLAIWIALSALAAAYGLFQHFFGFQPFEVEWMNTNIEYVRRSYQTGEHHVFSFLLDPAVFGILMACTSLLCLILLLTFGLKRWEKITLIGVLILCLPAMVFAGARTAYMLIPIGLFFFALLTLNRRILITVALIASAGTATLLIPTQNVHIQRISDAFQPWSLETVQVREANWERIQPFIRQHPLGSGLGTTGTWGQRFSPHTLLAKYLPNSGYVRIAVEAGWIGLLLYLSLFAGVLITGIRGYFRSTDERIRAYYPVFLTLIILMLFAHFPQEAITQLPISIFFYVSMAIVVKLKYLSPDSADNSRPKLI